MYTISVSNLQNLQFGSPSNRPIIFRCFFTRASPVSNATTILSWSLLNLSRSSVLFLHGLLKNVYHVYGMVSFSRQCNVEAQSSKQLGLCLSWAATSVCNLAPWCCRYRWSCQQENLNFAISWVHSGRTSCLCCVHWHPLAHSLFHPMFLPIK